jgi:hypothetical protein
MAIYRFVEPGIGRRRVHEWRIRALRILAFLALVICSATVGLALLDGSADPFVQKLLQGLWNSVNLVTTLGDFSAFDLRQKLFMLGAMLVAMVTGAYAVSQLTGILSSPEVIAYRENRQMERVLNELSGHAVIVGYAGPGPALARELAAAGQSVVVVDRDEERSARASAAGLLVIRADAAGSDDVLGAARLAHAGVMFVTTDDDHRNLTVTLLAHTLNPGLRIVVAAPDERWAEILRRAGAAEVVIANRVLAEAMLARPAPGTLRAAG